MTERTFGGYSVADLDTMGGDEIRAMDRHQLVQMRRDAQRDALRALQRLDRATADLGYRDLPPAILEREHENSERISAAIAATGDVIA
jgi:hypothetical protein